MLKAGMGAVQKWVTPSALSDPDVILYATWISVWGRWFIWLVAVVELVYRPGFWYPEDISGSSCLGVRGQRPCPLSASDEQVRDMAVAAPPQRHVGCPDHGRRCHRRRIHEFRLPCLLSVPRHFCRGVLVLLAQSRLDDHGRRCVRGRVPNGGLRA